MEQMTVHLNFLQVYPASHKVVIIVRSDRRSFVPSNRNPFFMGSETLGGGRSPGLIISSGLPFSGVPFWEVTYLLHVLGGSLSPRHRASSGCGWRNGLQLWRVAANMLNQHPQTNDKGCPPAWGFGVGLIPSP
jgi:hypothetical protein